MNLDLNTSNNLATSITIDSTPHTQTYPSPRDQDILKAISHALRLQHLHLHQLTSLSFFLGPGSFTGLRLGAAIANALSFSLSLPLNHHPPGNFLFPDYQKKPSITPPNRNQSHN